MYNCRIESYICTTMIKREMTTLLRTGVREMPVVTITGPRQSGKTTLVRETLPKYGYVNLERKDLREEALADPVGMLERLGDKVILDEVQHAPDLLSYIQVRVDEKRKNGQYVLTGSQNLLLLEKVSQSLAGRTHVLHLLPLSARELHRAGLLDNDPWAWVHKGGYPAMAAGPARRGNWLQSYIETYVQRDVRQVLNVQDLDRFGRFITLCAARTGQLWNQGSVATELGVDATTINRWLSLLQSSYIVFKLQPHHRNYNKRLVKTPKLYFHDTGLACNLLGIPSPSALALHWMKGPLLENAIMADRLKARYNAGLAPGLSFWRDNHGHEIDLLEEGNPMHAVEVKAGSTLTTDMRAGLEWYRDLTGEAPRCTLVYLGDVSSTRNGIAVANWRKFLTGKA